ncbi:hypothetical protein AB0M28_02745 [Streptomyces sp. NPDC051940]|uniref:ZIP family metal transporter n=1 Tax=Streptomyces sp. NPDC051940 TaxID=3155675 RepID=UPI00341D7839
MSVWQAVFWGAVSSATLYLGQALAKPMAGAARATGLVMAFGAGTLLSAVAYELIPASNFGDGLKIGAGVLLGAAVYLVCDAVIDRRGGTDRQRIADASAGGSGAAMFLGALLDGVPEAFILGLGLALGGAVNLAFLVAIAVSNIPQGIAGTASLRAAGYSGRTVFTMWTWLTVGCAATAGVGYVFADQLPAQGVYAEAFAAGAVLTMLTDSMMPESFRHGGRLAGLATVVGYLTAAALTFAQ